MDISALKTFLEVARTLHFGHAAENLFVSQSTVSARIRTLEESLGCDVFVRERGNIHLTKSGEALISHATSIVTLWARAHQELGMPEGVRRTLVVGGLSGLWDITLQDWLAKIVLEESDLVITADIFSADTLLERVMNGTMDIAFLYDAPQGQNLISQPLKTITLRLVSSYKVANAEEALNNGYISVDWGLNFAVQFASTFPEVTATKLYTGLGRIAFEYLKQNRGSAYLAESVAQYAVTRKHLYYVPQAPVFERKAYAIYHQGSDKTDLIQTLISEL